MHALGIAVGPGDSFHCVGSPLGQKFAEEYPEFENKFIDFIKRHTDRANSEKEPEEADLTDDQRIRGKLNILYGMSKIMFSFRFNLKQTTNLRIYLT